MRSYIRRHPFLSFYLLAVAFPTLLFTYLIVMEVAFPDLCGPGISVYQQFNSNMGQLEQAAPLLTQHRDSVLVYLTLYAMLPLAAPFLLFPFAPTVSALVITAAARGRVAVRALLGAYRPWRGSLTRREGMRIYGLLLVLMVGVVALVMLTDSLLNGGARVPKFVQTWGLADWRLFVVGWLAALFTNQGGLLEELGWRGYAWPVLVRKFGSPLLAAVLLGVAWAMWHLPREIPALLQGQQTLVNLLLSNAVFIVSCVGMTLVVVYFVNITGGSVLPAIMIHGLLNYLYAGFESGHVGVRSDLLGNPVPIVWLVAGLAALLIAGRDLGWKRRLGLHGGDGRTDPANLWSRSGGAPEGRT